MRPGRVPSQEESLNQAFVNEAFIQDENEAIKESDMIMQELLEEFQVTFFTLLTLLVALLAPDSG